MKSIEVKFNEALAAIDAAGKRKKFEETVRSGSPIEAKLNAAHTILKEVGVDIDNLEKFIESAKSTGTLETLKEQQYQSALAGGMSEAEARSFADLCGKSRR